MKKTTILHLLFGSFIFNGSIVDLFIRRNVILKVGPISLLIVQLFISGILKGVCLPIYNLFSVYIKLSQFLVYLSSDVVFSVFRAVLFLKWSTCLPVFRVLRTTKHYK